MKVYNDTHHVHIVNDRINLDKIYDVLHSKMEKESNIWIFLVYLSVIVVICAVDVVL